MTDHTRRKSRTERRERERAERDHNRRTRRLALTTFAALAEVDDTVSGMTMISPGGAVEFIDADVMFSGWDISAHSAQGTRTRHPDPYNRTPLRGVYRFCTGGGACRAVRFCSVLFGLLRVRGVVMQQCHSRCATRGVALGETRLRELGTRV